MYRRRLVTFGSALAGTLSLLWAVAVAAPAAASDTISLFAADSTPEVANFADGTAYDLGVRFSSDVDGSVSGVRFYKGPLNTGPHTGSLWAEDGTLLATATFADETDSGWQSVTFTTPVTIAAGVTYVASYHTTVGRYAVNVDAFASGLDSGPLHVPAGGGVFRIGSGFPDQSRPHNYWVDVTFVIAPPPTTKQPTPATTTALATTALATTGTASTTAAGGQLPVTGSDAGLAAGMGLLVLLTGVAVLVAIRRRRDRIEPST